MSHTTGHPDELSAEPGHDCGGCSLHDALSTPAAIERREFLKVGSMVLASLGILGARTGSAAAMAAPSAVPTEISALTPRLSDAKSEKRYAVPTADGVQIDKDNSVIIARVANKVYAFSLSCPHQNTALRWDDSDKVFMCPKHKSHYRPDGVFIEGRATRDMDRLPIRRDANAIVVDVDDVVQSDEKPREWTAAFVAL